MMETQIVLAMIAITLIDNFCDLIQTMLVHKTLLWSHITCQKKKKITVLFQDFAQEWATA